jgi:ribosome-associated toxin RatA of RatAB toxin-antitoxin module
MKNARRILLLLVGAGLLAAGGRAEEDVRVSGGAVVTLTKRTAELYELEGSFAVDSSPEAAWAVLTDYEHIQEFVPSVQSSRVLSRYENGAFLEQCFAGSVLFFSHKVTLALQVREDPLKKIAFEDTAHRDFILYAGEWRISASPGGCVVQYSLKAEPSFSVPPFLARRAFKRNVLSLLQNIRREIMRRAEKGGVS